MFSFCNIERRCVCESIYEACGGGGGGGAEAVAAAAAGACIVRRIGGTLLAAQHLEPLRARMQSVKIVSAATRFSDGFARRLRRRRRPMLGRHGDGTDAASQHSCPCSHT